MKNDYYYSTENVKTLLKITQNVPDEHIQAIIDHANDDMVTLAKRGSHEHKRAFLKSLLETIRRMFR